MQLQPINDCVLVELGQQHRNFSVSEGKYDTRTNGTVISIDSDNKELIGKKVYFEEYKEGARIPIENRIYCFIKYEDIRGYEDV